MIKSKKQINNRNSFFSKKRNIKLNITEICNTIVFEEWKLSKWYFLERSWNVIEREWVKNMRTSFWQLDISSPLIASYAISLTP